MADLIEIGVEVRTNSVRSATKEVDSLGKTLKSAERSASAFVDAFARQERQVSKAAIANKAYSSAAQKMYNDILKVDTATKSASASASVFAANLDKEARAAAQVAKENERLKNKFVEGHTAMNIYTKELNDLAIARKRDIITSKQQKDAVAQLNAQMKAGTGAFANAATGMQIVGKRANRTGVLMQQAGYQVGDFAVQVQSGTNYMVAFGQQATQLIGTFSMLAKSTRMIALFSGLGVIVPIATALAGAFLRTRDAASEAEEEVKTLSDSIQSLNTVQRTTAQDFEKGLNKAFDSSSEAVGRLLSLLREAEFEAAMGPIKDTLDEITVGVDRLDIALDTLVGFQKIIEKGGQLSVVQQRLRDDAQNLIKENLALAIAYEDVNAALDAIGGSTTTKELVANFAEALSLAETFAGPVGSELTEALLSAAKEAGLLEQVIRFAEEAAEDTSEATKGISKGLSDAANEAITLRDALQEVKMQSMSSAEQATVLRAQISAAQRGESVLSAKAQAEVAIELGKTSASIDQIAQAAAEAGANAEEIEKLEKTLSKITSSGKKAGTTTEDAMTDAEKALEEAKKAAGDYAKALDGQVISAIDGVANAWGDFVVRGFNDFKGFASAVLNSFKGMIAQMIAIAARNRIMLALGIGGVAPSAAMAGASGAAGGLLGGGLGIGAAVSGVGSGLAGVLSGGGLGSSFANLGGLMSGSVGGMGAIGAAIPAVGAIAVAIGLFTKKVKELDNGLRVTVDSTGTLVESFRDLETSRLFGLMKSRSMEYETADAEVADPVVTGVSKVQQSILDMANTLGVGSDAFSDFSYQFQVSLKGLSEEQALQAIQKEFIGVADAMAELVPELAEFANEGETASQTLARLASDLSTVNAAFGNLGRTALDASAQASAAASRLISAAGGQSQYISKTQTLVGSYLNPTEQLSYYQRQLEGVFEGGLPSKSKVKSILQEGSTEELETLYGGDTIQTLGTIFQLQDQIAREEEARKEEARRKAQAAADAAARAAKNRADKAAKEQQRILDERLGLEEQLLKLQGNTAELRRRELEALDPTNRALQEMVWKLEDAKQAMEGINEVDFKTLFDYQKAVAMSRISQPANIPAPVAMPTQSVVNGTTTNTPSDTNEGSTVQSDAFVRQSLVEIIKYSKRTSDTLRKFDVDGLPPERT